MLTGVPCFLQAEEIKHLYERFRNEKVIKEEEAEEMDEEYLKRARAALIDEEMKEAAESAARVCRFRNASSLC